MCLAIPGRITRLYQRADGAPMAEADFAGETRQVCLAYLPHLQVGMYTIVHAGFALSEVSAEQAAEIIATMGATGIIEQSRVEACQSGDISGLALTDEALDAAIAALTPASPSTPSSQTSAPAPLPTPA